MSLRTRAPASFTKDRAQWLLRALPAIGLLSVLVAVGSLTAIEPGAQRSYLLGRNTEALALPSAAGVTSKQWMAQIDSWSSENVPHHARWLEFHAYLVRHALRSPVVDHVYAGREDGRLLQISSGYPLTADFRANAQSLSDAAEASAVPLMWVYVPRTEEAFLDVLPAGFPTPYEEHRSDLLEAFETGDSVLDLTALMSDPAHRDEYFYYTDHHWTPFGAWAAVQAITDQARAQGIRLGTDDRPYVRLDTDIRMIGSLGRLTTLGALTHPDYFWTYEPEDGWRSSVCREEKCSFPPVNSRYLTDPDPYADRYMSFIQAGLADPDLPVIGHFVNDSPEAQGTVLILQDSFGDVADMYLAEQVRELWVVKESGYVGEDFIDLIARLNPDLVLVMHNQPSLLNPARFNSHIWVDAPEA